MPHEAAKAGLREAAKTGLLGRGARSYVLAANPPDAPGNRVASFGNSQSGSASLSGDEYAAFFRFVQKAVTLGVTPHLGLKS
jgi:hypothetical protein